LGIVILGKSRERFLFLSAGIRLIRESNIGIVQLKMPGEVIFLGYYRNSADGLKIVQAGFYLFFS
jgi:hypothetical protein